MVQRARTLPGSSFPASREDDDRSTKINPEFGGAAPMVLLRDCLLEEKALATLLAGRSFLPTGESDEQE